MECFASSLKVATGSYLNIDYVIEAINHARDLWYTNRIHLLNFSGWNFPIALALEMRLMDIKIICVHSR